MSKKCSKCNKIKNKNNFYKRKKSLDGLAYICKSCSYAYSKKYDEQNKDRRNQYYELNKESILKKQKQHRSREKVKSNINQYCKQRRRTDLNIRLKDNISSRIRKAINRGSKNTSSINLIGCSIEKLKTHLEKQFTDGMSWDNYGEWHIDHIKPCCSFDLSKESEQKQCFHYSNMQPLWALDNLKKSGKFFT